ncbi:unnamed protein product [Ixodes persulcatus]
MSTPAFSCQACGMTFTGPEPYNQHLASVRHKRKVEMVSSVIPHKACLPCGMTFTGPAPYRQSNSVFFPAFELLDHMASTGHAKVMAKQEVMSNAASITDCAAVHAILGFVAGTVACPVCNIAEFPSMSAAFCHYESQEHRKNKLMAACGISPAPVVPVSTKSQVAAPLPPPLLPTPKLPSSVLVCRADEDFGEFCEKHGFFKFDN